ncbi:MAG: histidine kinase [Bacteroidetes bacterium HGW-Bacteroidetes-4]|jgi:LytS/YehU family sensor histidine kinase|nr:MAG: histidine kinase [Bacteroidetes bacterium HGW-Bacteroidetes-4]
MEYQSIIKNSKTRISAALLVGILFKFFSDVIFGLLYKNYAIFQPYFGYIYAVILSLLALYLFYFIELWLNKKLRWQNSILKRFFVQLGLESVTIFTLFIVLRWILLWIFYNNTLVVFTDELVLIATVVLVTFIYNVLNLGSFLLFEWRYSLAELERFKKENAESRFEALQNQVNPHFLFNSLNTLSSLMYHDVDAAAKYIRQLSQVYRYVLENSNNELVTLKQELEFIDAYEFLLSLRFTDRIHFKRTIAPEQEQMLIAPMTLQILVENAVKHNIISSKKPLHISLVANDGWISVTNNLQMKQAEGYSSGQGLNNIESRYRFLTEKNMQIEKSEQTFKVDIPLIHPSEKTKIDT